LSFIDTICASIGVAVLGGMRKANGSYENAFILMMVLTVLSLVATYIINQRAKKGFLLA
jgi:cyanate permease